MTKDINIREYKKSDKESVLNLLRLNTPQYFSHDEEKDLIRYLDNEIENYYVITCENRIAGCGGFNFSGDPTTGRISWDIFHPEFQGKGLGTYLLKYRIEKLKNYSRLKTISVRTSQLVYKFYEKSGFTLKEVIEDYWAEGFDLYRMEYTG